MGNISDKCRKLFNGKTHTNSIKLKFRIRNLWVCMQNRPSSFHFTDFEISTQKCRLFFVLFLLINKIFFHFQHSEREREYFRVFKVMLLSRLSGFSRLYIPLHTLIVTRVKFYITSSLSQI